MQSIREKFLQPDALPLRPPHALDAISNSSKYTFLTGTQLIQLYTFPTQNSNINLHSKPPFSHLLRHTRVKAVMQF